jgi:hypothetical protein
MKRIVFPLKPQMKGTGVADLLAALALLGFKIADAETTAQRYGASTRKAVRQFQAEHRLQPQQAGVVDEATAGALNTLLAERGALDDPGGGDTPPPPEQPPPYSISGEVVQPDGTPMQEYPVRAFDRALGDWRALGAAKTDDLGRYRITYDPAQLSLWGKARADLKLEVYDKSGDVMLASSPTILQARTAETVNFAIGSETYRGPAEYTRVETALAPHLQPLSDLSRLGAADVMILSRQTGLANSNVAYYIKAQRWSADFEAPAALFYGLLRRNQPTRLDALLARPLTRLWAALEEAKAQNIIDLPLIDALRTQLAGIQQGYLARPEHPYAQLLNTTALSAAQQAVFTERLTAGDLTGDAFWQSLGVDDGFSAEQVGDLKDTFELQAFADDNTSLSVHLRSAHNLRAPREVAVFSVEQWRDAVLTGDGVEVPEDILPGAAEPERRAAYAHLLYRSAELHYSTRSFAGQLTRSLAWAGTPVLTFLTNYPYFEFRDERITYFLQAHPEVTELFPDAQTGRAELLRVEQLFHLVPPENKLATMQPLWDAGLRSAPQIAVRGRHRLLRMPGGLDRNTATGIYRRAVHITSVALHVYARYHPRLNSLSPYAVRTPQLPREQALARDATELPEWEALFGSTDACECAHCQSALSPAAYLVDSMDFLQRAVAEDDSDKNALDELLERRPDLDMLWLTCENTETEMPHIDLQTQIMEAIVASSDHKTLLGHAILQTTWDSDQQDAQPEHLEPRAYDVLRESVHPLDLPFDLWLEEGRRYLKQMGIARHELMQVMPPKPDIGPLEIATEALQMSTREREIIRVPNTLLDDLEAFWGVDPANGTLRQQLGRVETLMRQAKLDYTTLLRLLNTRYVNAGRWVVVTFSDDACALDGAELARADGAEFTSDEFQSFLDRLHRFLRLQRRLRYTEYELDTVLAALAAEDFNADGCLSKLADAQALQSTFGLSITELSSWWAARLDTHIFEEELPSQYQAIFLDPLKFPTTYAGSGPDLRDDAFALKPDLSDLVITASNAALSPWLATSDGEPEPTYALDLDYATYIQSATLLTTEDVLTLVAELLPKDAGTGHVALNLANVSLLYRIVSFTQAMGISVTDYLRLTRLTGISPLTTPARPASPMETLALKTCYDQIDSGQLSLEQLAYLLRHESDAVAVLAPLTEDMDAWLATMNASFADVEPMKPASVSADLKTALTQSLGSTLGLDAAVLNDLLFFRRPTMGDTLLAHLISAANPELPDLPAADFHTLFERLHKFAMAWNALELDASHLAFVLDEGPALGWIDIAALPSTEQNAEGFTPWSRLTAAVDLQTSVFTVEQSLFGLLQAAKDLPQSPTATELDALFAQISDASGWSLTDLAYLIGPNGFNLNLPEALLDERPFVDLRRAFDLYRRTGVSAELAHTWASAVLTFGAMQSIKQALTLSYDPDSWPGVLATIQDELRLLRRDALLGYLLHVKGFKDSTEFYHYYLMDPEQAACARTSRIVEALAAGQIFAQRILLNLEPPFAFGPEDAEAWRWRKNYRVWEAARKVFLYPENWLEPEFRDNKSAFFKELEDGLAQDDINLTTAERLYREYLYKLDRVSRLEIMGMYEEQSVSGGVDTNVLHVFGRTRDIPHLYYYRRWEDQARWTPWEPVPLDIQADHLIPIVYNGRLYLFWPDFKVTELVESDGSESKGDSDTALTAERNGIEERLSTEFHIDDFSKSHMTFLANSNIKSDVPSLCQRWLELTDLIGKVDEPIADSDARPVSQIELGMVWSEYRQGEWTPKVLSNEKVLYTTADALWRHFFTGWVTVEGMLRITIRINKYGNGEQLDVYAPEGYIGYFYLDECNGQLSYSTAAAGAPMGTVFVTGSLPSSHSVFWGSPTYSVEYFELQVGVDAEKRLLLNSGGYLHYAHQYGQAGRMLSPFFYTDSTRTYFVEPLPDVPVLISTAGIVGTAQRSAGDAARTALPIGQTGLATDTHYQGTNDGQIIDRGFPTLSAGAITTLNTRAENIGEILAEDSPPQVVTQPAEYSDFRYRFTRFYHPYTCLFLKQLGRYGVEGLLNPPPDGLDDDSENLYRQLTPLASFDFEATYLPNSEWVLDNYDTEAIAETIDFDHNSPYGSYNWELFFHIPLLIATRLMQNQRFDEARRWFHYIFDPTCTNGDGTARFWKIKPFYEEQSNGPTETLQELIDLLERGDLNLERQVQEWEEDPFNLHAIARLRITAYMQATVRKYLDCLIKHADVLFMGDTRERINEAAQLYLLAAEILGPRPTLLPAQEAELLTPNKLLGRAPDLPNPGELLDPLGPLTSILQTFSQGVSSSRTSLTVPGLSGSAIAAQGGTDSFNTLFYFCLPHNDLLYIYWDTLADRLFKIRHCMNISGQVRQLALFDPPIDPALLVRASAAGLDIAAIISGMYAPLPHYRFTFMLQKALELCGEVRSLGGALSAALEKKDGEELAVLRSTHEVGMLGAMRAVKQKNVEEADASLDGLLKSKESAEFRAEYYSGLERVSSGEQKSLDRQEEAARAQHDADSASALASMLYQVPNVTIEVGVGASVGTQFGGANLGGSTEAIASLSRSRSAKRSHEASKAGTMAGYDRRLQDWRFQADLAKKEIAQLDKQILAAEIRKQIADIDLANHETQIAHAEEVEEFLKLKFTNQDLYSWMVTQLSGVYFQSYQLACDLAKRAEQAYAHELGVVNSGIVSSGYWDSLKKGLIAGDLLNHDLRRLETSYHDLNKRELEITKAISLLQLDPAALLDLRETGECEFAIPEVVFDLDFSGHYFRRIKAVRVTIPCVAGPYTSVSATLQLEASWIRRSDSVDTTATPPSLPPLGDPEITLLPQTTIATSTASQDGGVFELNFNDPRYLPFEGAGAISKWKLELPQAIRPIDYDTIADAVIHVSYTARESATSLLKQAVDAQMDDALNAAMPARLISLRQEFATEWSQFLAAAPPQTLTLHLGKQHFPRYLDHFWEDTDADGKPDTKKEIALLLNVPRVYLDPQGQLPLVDAANIQVEYRPTNKITNDSEIELVLTVDGSEELRAEVYKNMYLLIKYEVDVSA